MNGLSSLLIRAVLAVVVLAACVAPAVAQEVVEYIHTDALCSPVTITDASGNVIERTVYEPYGAVVNRPLKDGPGYTGHVTDSGTGLSYMQQRYMDPALGAFLSVDPVTIYSKGDMRHFTPYAYAYNNPYKFSDPDGRCGACDRHSDQFARDAAAGKTDVYSPMVEPASAIAVAALPAAPVVRSVIAIARSLTAQNRNQSSEGAGASPKGDPHAPGDVPNANVIVRGGAGEMPAQGSAFSASQGRSVQEAGAGVPHGTIRTSTAGEIRSGGGKVDVAPEPTRAGNVNFQHVNVAEGRGAPSSFSPPQSNPVPKIDRIK